MTAEQRPQPLMALQNEEKRNSWLYEPHSLVPTRRRYSSILSNFPWYWEGIVRNPQDLGQFVDKIPEFKHFIQSLVRFEKHTFSIGSTQSASGILGALGVRIEHSSSLSKPPRVFSEHKQELTATEFQHLASVIGAYSFFEVIALRANLIPRIPPSLELTAFHLPPSKTKVQQELHGWHDIANWFNVLFDFRKIMTKLPSIDDKMQTLKSKNPLVTVLKMVVRSNTTNEYQRIENNLLYAALHVNYMKAAVFSEDQVPDLPRDLHKGKHPLRIDANLNGPVDSHLEAGIEDPSVLDELSKTLLLSNGGPGMLRNALHVSEILTPLFLILPRQLVKVSFHRRTLLELAAKVRPHKPAILLKIEDLIWDAVFALSRGGDTPNEVLAKLLKDIPWNEVEIAAAAPREYSLTALYAGKHPLVSNFILMDVITNARTLVPETSDASRAQPSPDSASLSENDSHCSVGRDNHRNVLLLDSSPASAVSEKTCHEVVLGASCTLLEQSTTQLPPPLDEDVLMGALEGVQRLEDGELLNDILLSTQPVLSLTAPVAPYGNLRTSEIFDDTVMGLQSQTACGLKFPVESDQGFLHPLDVFTMPEVDLDLSFGSESILCDFGLSHGPRLTEGKMEHSDGLSQVTTQVGHAGQETTISHEETESELSSPPSSSEDSYDDDDSDLSTAKRSASMDRTGTGPSVDRELGPSSSKPKSSAGTRRKRSSKLPSGGTHADTKLPSGRKPGRKSEAKPAKSSNTSSGKRPGRGSHPPPSGGGGLGKNFSVSPDMKSGQGSNAKSRGTGSKRPRDGEGEMADNLIDLNQFYSIFEPFVVKEFVENKEINFDYTKAPRRIRSIRRFVAYTSKLQKIEFKPTAHHKVFLSSFATFMKKAKAHYVKDKPRFISEPDTSCLVITDYKDFTRLDAVGKQALLKGKSAAIIRNWPVKPDLKFDAEGLRSVTACLTAPADLLDYSVLSAGIQCSPTLLTGKAQDLLDNAHSNGKILNGLDFPKWNGSLESNDLAVDIDAWEFTRGLHFLDERGAAYPTPDMNWNLAATADAITNIHVDADGTFTKNLIGCGRKGWGFLKDTAGLSISSINFFLHEQFRLYETSRMSAYEVEFIVMERGDMLLMKPSTPHFVITLDHSICYGGHLYSTATMQQTLVGMIHTFVLDRFISNAAHHPSRLLIRRVLLFYHVGLVDRLVSNDEPVAKHLPDVSGIDGLLNLLSACVLVVLANVLDFRTYIAPNQYEDTEAEKRLEDLMSQIDLNSIPENERRAICYARGVALHVMAWIRHCCIIKFSDTKDVQIVHDLPSRFLVQIASSLLNYKGMAEQQELNGAPHSTLEQVRRQLENLVACDPLLESMWSDRETMPSDFLELRDKDKYTIEWQGDKLEEWKGSKPDFLRMGLTGLDLKYFEGYSDWCQHQACDILPSLAPSQRMPQTKKAKRS